MNNKKCPSSEIKLTFLSKNKDNILTAIYFIDEFKE